MLEHAHVYINVRTCTCTKAMCVASSHPLFNTLPPHVLAHSYSVRDFLAV